AGGACADDYDGALARLHGLEVVHLAAKQRVDRAADLRVLGRDAVEAVVAGDAGADVLGMAAPGLVAPLGVGAVRAAEYLEVVDALLEELLGLVGGLDLVGAVDGHVQRG